MLFILAAIAAAEPPGELDLAELTRAVLDANPEVDTAAATLTKARARIAAAAPWPAPMVDVSVAPLTLGGMPGWQVEVRQDIPTWGVRRAALDMADADADAAELRLDMMRLDLADMTAMAWADWYAVHRELDLTAATVAVLRETRAMTLSWVAIGRASDLNVLQIDAEIGWLNTRRLSLAAERDVVAYRINTLSHRPIDADVKDPPSVLLVLPPATQGVRPEIAESFAMTRAAEAQERMARADRLPMLGVMTGWDAMQEMPKDRWMVGISVQVPLDQKARTAEVEAAAAGVALARAESERTDDRLKEDIATAERRYRADVEVLAALEAEVLPVARARLAAARSAYASGAADLRLLLDAERAGLEAETWHEQQVATVVLRARELEIAHGILLPGAVP